MYCPECKTRIEVRQLRYPEFKCASCRCDLRIPTAFQWKTLGSGVLVAFFGCFLLGLKGIALVMLGVLFSFVIGSVIEFIMLWIAPPVIEKALRPGSLGLR